MISPENPEMPSSMLPKLNHVLNISLKLDFFHEAFSHHLSLTKFIHSFTQHLFIKYPPVPDTVLGSVGRTI